jgi:K+-transporting ATPase ATPase A chain
MNMIGTIWRDWAEIIVILALVGASAPLLAAYMARVFAGQRTPLSPEISPVERVIYVAAGVDPTRGQDWRRYLSAMLAFNAAGFVLLYAILRLQNILPFNPAGLPGLPDHLAFNTAVSFVTNTNWQSYGGETTMSLFSQMAGLTVQNFVSAATGIGLALAVVRAFASKGGADLGNFWVDLTRTVLYVLLPLSLVLALVYVALGVPQTLQSAVSATTLEGGSQTIAMGPVASQLAIKMLGTNGGGFFNVNSAHPFENPNAWTNLISIWAILALSFAMPLLFGRMVGDRRQGWALFAAMGILLVAAIVGVYAAESAGNPILQGLGVATGSGNLEGKEVRFGVDMSALWAAATAGTSNGSVNAMLSSFTPLGGLVPLLLIQLGEVVPGGVGSGLYGMILFAVLAVFIAGLMVGRTPEYLGKKIGAKEIKMAMLAVLILPVAILGFAALSAVLEPGRAGVLNAGPHGLSEILYAFSSAGGNNGSAFAGLTANSPWYNTTLGIAMLLGRFAYVVPVMALAGSLAVKVKTPPTVGTFPTTGPLFVGLLIGVILILGGLQFFPALALGPIVEHLLMQAGVTF